VRVERDKWAKRAAEPGTLGATVLVLLPCHPGLVLGQWVSALGRLGRLQCTQQGCRRVYEDVVLEGWSE